jgi:hypothetical protein
MEAPGLLYKARTARWLINKSRGGRSLDMQGVL